MRLKKIELTGFKSFARKTTLDFSASVTAIVGPNGSGKSNVAEAMRFVLGEQSIKSMRGKRGEDLIWNGSKMAGRLNHASVFITFDNVDRVFDIDYDERSYPKKIRWNNAEKIIQDLGFDQKKIKAMYKAVAERLSKCDKDDLKLLDRSILPEAVKLYMTFA